MSIRAIATNTFREAIRDRILYLILVFAVLMIGSSYMLTFLSVGQEQKIIIDLGLGAINIFCVIITIFIATTLLNKEIDKRTIFLLLTKPLSRYEFILGKHLGLGMTLFVLILTMGLVFTVLIAVTMNTVAYIIWPVLALIFVEVLLLTAAAIFFSTFASPIMSACYTLGLYVIGHLSQDLLKVGKMAQNENLEMLTTALYYVLPDLEVLNLKNQIFSLSSLDLNLFSQALAYGLFYMSALLILAMLNFERREF